MQKPVGRPGRSTTVVWQYKKARSCDLIIQPQDSSQLETNALKGVISLQCGLPRSASLGYSLIIKNQLVMESLLNQDLTKFTDDQLFERKKELASNYARTDDQEWDQIINEQNRRVDLRNKPEHDERSNWPEPLN